MFCPKCGRRNEDEHKYCRDCGENLKLLSKAMERRWRKWLNRALDPYIRNQNRKLAESARSFRRLIWIWLGLIAASLIRGLADGDKNWWAMPLVWLSMLLIGFWDYVAYRRLSTSGSNDNKRQAKSAATPDSAAELHSAPTTNELAPPFSVTEPTTRRLEPLSAAKKRSGELL